jgi:Pyruvate/2-oxoacid:ferredoxin oxidoreductase delta subunit
MPDRPKTHDYRSGEPFAPADEQMALWPAVSGNAINGLGEREVRRPTPVYWHHHSTIPHGEAMMWMVKRLLDAVEEVRDLADKFGGRGADDPVPIAETAETDTPETWARRVKAAALEREADLVGIARLRDEWVFEGYDVPETWVIVLAIAMDQAEVVEVAPSPRSVIEVSAQYNRGTRASKALADWIRERGHPAVGHGGPIAGPVTMIPAAIEAGFGELGKHGSIINRRYGSSFRLACVLTDLPLVADAPDLFGADDFCRSCRVCARYCPPQAIDHAKHRVRGVEKWYVDFDRCVPYFNETYGCGLCVGICPWSRPGVAPSLARRMSRRKARADGT